MLLHHHKIHTSFLPTKVCLKFLLLFLFSISAIFSFAQENALYEKVSIEFSDVPLKNILSALETKTGITFGYNSRVIPLEKSFSLSVKNTSLEKVLQKLFKKESIVFKCINDQILLYPKKAVAPSLSKNTPPNKKTTQLTQKPKKQYTLSGRITDMESGVPLAGANVYVSATASGASTDKNGYFIIAIPKGTHTVQYSYVGYLSIDAEITMRSDQNITVRLENASQDLKEVVISDAEKKLSEQIQMSKINIPMQQVKKVPIFLGEKDVMKVMSLMPGVQASTEGQSGFTVRGGNKDHNLILIDGTPVFGGQHMLGLFSFFDGESIKSSEILKGGFPARYGGRLSSVVDMQLREGNKEKWSGGFGIGLLSAKAQIEGPIQKGKSSFIITGRRSYWDFILRPIIRNTSSDGADIGYYFLDGSTKLTFQLSPKNRILCWRVITVKMYSMWALIMLLFRQKQIWNLQNWPLEALPAI